MYVQITMYDYMYIVRPSFWMMTITSLLVLIPSLVSVSAHMARESNLSEEVSATYWTDEICVVWSQGGFLLLSFLAPFFEPI